MDEGGLNESVKSRTNSSNFLLYTETLCLVYFIYEQQYHQIVHGNCRCEVIGKGKYMTQHDNFPSLLRWFAKTK